MKTLNVIETAYRATIEEQDDTIVWFMHALKGAGADLTVLLRGNAVNYGVHAQDAGGLRFGDVAQTQPPRLADDVAKLAEKGVPVFCVEEDLEARGIAKTDVIGSLSVIRRADVPALFERHARIWYW